MKPVHSTPGAALLRTEYLDIVLPAKGGFPMSTWMTRIAVASIAGLAGCAEESVDWTGEWVGVASLVVDGERQQVPLRLGLRHDGARLGGTIHWGGHSREITTASTRGPEVDLESVTSTDRFRMKGLFRNDAITGQFWIHYPADPEPYPGSFKVERQP
jgi:hypothetical protein